MLPSEPARRISRPSLIAVTGWLACGLALLLGILLGQDLDPAIAGEVPVEALVGVLLSGGASLVLLAAFPWPLVSTSWNLELLAWPPLAGGWALYSVLALLHGPGWVEIVLGFFFAMASLYRFFELSLIVRRTRGQVERLRNSEGG